MEKPEKMVLSHLRAADGGARLILQIEKTTVAHVRLAAGFPKSIGQKRAIVFLGK